EEGRSSGAAYAAKGRRRVAGFRGLHTSAGAVSANVRCALAARGHMTTYGTTSEQLGAIAVAQRAWAAMSPLAQRREPMTLAEHQASPWVADPLRRLDCCLVSNGGPAVVGTTAERASPLAR